MQYSATVKNFPRTTGIVSAVRAGFTVMEILIVVGIIGILASVTIVALNPRKQLCEAQNAKRLSHINALEKAMQQYLIDEWTMAGGDDVPTGEENALPVCAHGATDESCVSLDVLVPDYVAALPVDPEETNAVLTGFAVYKEPTGRQRAVASHYRDPCVDAVASSEGASQSASAGSSAAASSAQSSEEAVSSEASSEQAESSQESSAEMSSEEASSEQASSEEMSSQQASSEETSSQEASSSMTGAESSEIML